MEQPAAHIPNDWVVLQVFRTGVPGEPEVRKGAHVLVLEIVALGDFHIVAATALDNGRLGDVDLIS
jgi:hypothetical protein